MLRKYVDSHARNEGSFERALHYGVVKVGLSMVHIADIDCSMLLRDNGSFRDEVACSLDLVVQEFLVDIEPHGFVEQATCPLTEVVGVVGICRQVFGGFATVAFRWHRAQWW